MMQNCDLALLVPSQTVEHCGWRGRLLHGELAVLPGWDAVAAKLDGGAFPQLLSALWKPRAVQGL